MPQDRWRRLKLLALGVPGLSAALALGSPSSMAGPAPSGPPAPVAIEAQLSGDAAATKLVFTLSSTINPTVKTLEKPDRIVLDLAEVNFQLPAETGRKSRGLVKSFRYGLIGPGRSRVVIELAGPATVARTSNESVMEGAANAFVIELRRTDRDSFAKAAAADRSSSAEPPLRLAQGAAADHRPVVVLDPGHGGIDTGAIGIGHTVEKDVVFAFTQELKAKLEKSGRFRVVVTRDTDEFISLRDRVRIAQANNASLFVSIHADTLQASPEVRGLTVYTNADRASDAEAARLADTENKADSLAGVDSESATEEVAGILGELTRRETRTYSHLFARTLVGKITAASKLNKNPHRSAGFWVLRAPDVPSVLVELGYLSSKSDVELLTAQGWRDKATDSISAAITGFLSPRIVQQSQVATP
jgi:N-acetylmuramoyl-L-alanine amidase